MEGKQCFYCFVLLLRFYFARHIFRERTLFLPLLKRTDFQISDWLFLKSCWKRHVVRVAKLSITRAFRPKTSSATGFSVGFDVDGVRSTPRLQQGLRECFCAFVERATFVWCRVVQNRWILRVKFPFCAQFC